MAFPEKQETLKTFPNPLAPAKVKKIDDFGIAYARAMWEGWNANLTANTSRVQRWKLNRKYAEGMQSMDKYKNLMDMDGDTSFANLDFTPHPIIADRTDKFVGKLINQEYKIRATILNPESQVKQDKFRNKLYANMLLRDISAEAEQRTGVPLIPPGEYVPEDTIDAEMYMKMNFKLADAIATELAIDYVHKCSRFKDIEEKLIRDLVVIKRAAVKRRYDANGDLKVEYEDPVDVITPYSKNDDFSNIPHIAVLKKYNIQQIAQLSKGKFSEQELFDIASKYAGAKYGNRNWTYGVSYEGYYQDAGIFAGRPYDDFNIDVLEFEFLGIDKKGFADIKRKKDGEKKFITDYDSKAKKNPDFDVEDYGSTTITNRYEGSWIIGSELIYGYGLTKNMPREKKGGVYSSNTDLSITMIAPNIYDMENKSHVERMIFYADQMQLIIQKMQQFIISAIPPGIAWDESAFENLVKGMGDSPMKKTEFVKFFKQTGSTPFRSQREDGSVINGRPIEILPNGLPVGFEQFINAYNQNYDMLNQVTGYNAATDGSDPNPNALVGTSNLAALGTDNAMRPLKRAYVRLIEKHARVLACMIQDKIEYGGGLAGFKQAIGTESAEVLDAADGISALELGIEIEYVPDEAERMETMQLAVRALDKEQITIDDMIRFKRILKSDIMLAESFLTFSVDKRRKERIREAQGLQQQNGEIQVQSAQMTAEAEQQTTQVKAATKIEEINAQGAVDFKRDERNHLYRMEEIALQNSGKTEVQESANKGKVASAHVTESKKHESKIEQMRLDKLLHPKEQSPAEK